MMILTLGSGTEVRKNPWEFVRGRTVLAIAQKCYLGQPRNRQSLNGPDSSTKTGATQPLTD